MLNKTSVSNFIYILLPSLSPVNEKLGHTEYNQAPPRVENFLIVRIRPLPWSEETGSLRKWGEGFRSGIEGDRFQAGRLGESEDHVHVLDGLSRGPLEQVVDHSHDENR